METNALLRRTAEQALVTAFGFAVAAVLVTENAADVATAMWKTVAVLVVVSVVTFAVTSRRRS